jgi:hypothetical protein
MRKIEGGSFETYGYERCGGLDFTKGIHNGVNSRHARIKVGLECGALIGSHQRELVFRSSHFTSTVDADVEIAIRCEEGSVSGHFTDDRA